MVKCCLQADSGAIDVSGARAQFAGLRHMWQRVGRGARFGVPEPVLLLEEHGIIVAEWVQGRSLTQALCHANARPDVQHALVDDAAEWLRRFHGGDQLAPVTLACADLVARLREGDPWVLRNATFQRGYRLLEQLSPRVAAVELECSDLHGDFKADNLLVSAERVVAIDVQPDHRSARLYDVTSFVNHLELLAWQPMAWGVALRRERLIRRFIGNYFPGDLPESQRLALAWLRLFNLLGAWLDMPVHGRSLLRVSYNRFCYERVARRLCGELAVFGGP
jgi:hypothetical protein